jgi:hypothetical protein
MKESKIFIVLSLIVIQTITNFSLAQGQDKENRVGRLKSQKVAFLTEKVGLSSQDAQKFWPVYNEFSAKEDSLWNEKRENINRIYNSDKEMTASQKEAAIDRHVDFELKEARLKKQYHEKFKKILTIDQVIKLYGAEYEFKKKMLHLLREGKPSSCGGECKSAPHEMAKL